MSADNHYPFIQRRSGISGGGPPPAAVAVGASASGVFGGASSQAASAPPTGIERERRSFADAYEGLSPGAVELAQAIDNYKAQQRRRFITYEEMLAIVLSLGYRK